MANFSDIHQSFGEVPQTKFFYLSIPLVVISLLLNAITCLAIFRCHELHKMLFALIFNLALADIVTDIALCLHGAISLFGFDSNQTEFNGDIYCGITGIGIVGGMTLSTFTLVAISIERFKIMVLKKNDNDLRRKKRNFTVLILFLWIVSYGISTPCFYLFQFRPYPQDRSPYRCILYTSSVRQFRSYLILYSIVVYLMPLAMIVTAYSRIWTYINRFAIHEIIISSNRSALLIRNRRKYIFKMLIISTTTFMIFTAVIVYVPIMLVARDQIRPGNEGSALIIVRIGIILYLVSTIINPLIYNYYCSAFRQAYTVYLPISLCCIHQMPFKIVDFLSQFHKPTVRQVHVHM